MTKDKDGSKTPPPPPPVTGGKPATPPPSSSTTPPPPPTPPTPQSEHTKLAASTSNPSCTKRPMTPKKKSAICPVCNKQMYHEKALNGHIRWHSHEEREMANQVARALALSVNVNPEDQGSNSSNKRMKVVPDLNKPPPPED